jgi:trimeric autotransporter adhesin
MLTTHSTSLPRWLRAPARALAMGTTAVLVAVAAYAAPPAGTTIGNQASATYTDASNVTRTVTSNVVTAVVQQVAALTLTTPLAKNVSVGGQVVYPLTLTNTGNGTDTFALSTLNTGGYTFNSVTLYADANGDGVADNTTPITSSTPLASGEVFRFVAVANVPTTATSGQINNLVVTADSQFDTGATVVASVTDVTTVTANAVLNVTKTMSAVSGNSGTGPYSVTLTYSNTGNTPASNVIVADPLPAGMVYVPGSARWSVTGPTVILTDAADGLQGASPTIAYDFGASTAGQATATINSVAAGQSGTLTFQVNIAAGLPVSTLNNTARYGYFDGATVQPNVNTNTFTFSVNQTAAATFTGQTVASAAQGSTVTYNNTLTNNGNGTDTFDITVGTGFPVGTAYTLFKADGVSPLLDTNGNGIPDTGPVAAGATYNVVLNVTLPSGALGGPYSVGKTATSAFNPTVAPVAVDTLTAIVANTVDLTNNSALPGAPGAGPGVEVAAVTTNTVLPGATTRFTLFVNNTSATGDTFNLSASTDATFAALSLPAGWTVVFRNAAGTVITNTGVIAGGGNVQVFADVTVPANQVAIPAPGADLYFRVVSPASGAVDRKHDAVIVQTVRSVQLVPNNSGQVFPGGSVVYAHTLTNAGNVAENTGGANTISLALADSQGVFTSVVYLDANSSNTIDAGDVVINTPADLGPVAAGQAVRLLVRVSAVSGAGVGVIDTTTLTATTAGVINGVAAPAVVTVIDGTTVISGNLVLVKEQALDANCDGVADTAFGTATVSTGAIPGACIRYRITVTNNGVADVATVVVSDSIPTFTTYHGTIVAASTQGAVTAPAAGAVGTVSVAVGTLTPSQSVVITFGVRIDPL